MLTEGYGGACAQERAKYPATNDEEAYPYVKRAWSHKQYFTWRNSRVAEERQNGDTK